MIASTLTLNEFDVPGYDRNGWYGGSSSKPTMN